MSTYYFVSACVLMVFGTIANNTGSCIISAGMLIASEIAGLRK